MASETFGDIGASHAMDQLRGDIANLIGDYYQRNNEYRLNELIDPAVHASLASGSGTAWLVELGRSMGNPETILWAMQRSPGLTDAQRISIQRDLVALRARQVESAFGDNRVSAEAQLLQARAGLVFMLLNAHDVAGASSEWNQAPADEMVKINPEVAIRLAAGAGTLDALLKRYDSDRRWSFPADTLQRSAVALRREGNENAARSVLEFLYERELRNGQLQAANFLGLAEVKLQRNDAPTAVALLNRMALVVEDGFDTLLPASTLLAKYGKTAESVDFVRRRIKAAPWDSEAGLQLARTLPADSSERAPLLAAVISDSQAVYTLRAEAARLSSRSPVAAVSGTEFALLSSPSIAPDAAAKPFQVEARIDAARTAADPAVRLRLWREALAIAPIDERVRLGTLRAAIASRRDSLALALNQAQAVPQIMLERQAAYYNRRAGYSPYTQPIASPEGLQIPDSERASIAESLAAAAERLDDLPAAQGQLRIAIDLRPEVARAPLVRKLDALIAEQNRRTANSARQPVIKDVIEQDRIVRTRIPRSDQ
jgi:hypothetical protein